MMFISNKDYKYDLLQRLSNLDHKCNVIHNT